MSRRRPRGPREPFGPVRYIDAEKIIALAPLIQHIAILRGVAERYVPDLVQEALFQAWHAMISGRFRVPEGIDVDAALRSWVIAIAFNQVMNWQARAFNRREVPFADPLRFETERVEPWPRYEARAVLRLAAEMFPPDLRPVFILMMRGIGVTEIAVILDTPTWIVRRRMTEVRTRLAAIASGEG